MPEATLGTDSLVALRSVRKTYRDGNVEALRGVSLDIVAGEFLSIMGPSGCGKSTLLNIVGALDLPSEGQVLFRGQPLASVANLDRLRAKEIGFVFQSFYLLPNLTALENVQIPMFEGSLPLEQRSAAAESLLGMVGLADRLHHLPNQLSIGQRQRVAIARALANGPSIILADEPTGSLDSQSGREIMEILCELNASQGTTVVVVTHDPLIANYGQRLVRMLDGQVQEDKSLV